MRDVALSVENEDLARADVLALKLAPGATRTEVFRRAVHLAFWAFCSKGGDRLVVMRDGREVGSLKWSKEPGR